MSYLSKTHNVTWEATNRRYLISPINDALTKSEIESPFSEDFDFPQLIGAIYTNECHTEAKVLTIRNKNGVQIGYLMRASASLSNDVGYSDKLWFRKAAILTAFWILQHAESVAPQTNGKNTNIDSIFTSDISILILDSNKAKESGIKKLSQIDSCLFSFGFKRLSSKNYYTWNPGTHAAARLLQVNKSIKVHPLPKSTKHEDFLNKIFSTYIPESTLPVVRFFYYYQVIELLIEKVAAKELSDSVDRLSRLNDLGNTSGLREEAARLQNLFKEREKINIIFSQLSPPPVELSILSAAAKRILNLITSRTKETAADGIYSIRNQLFHNYRVGGEILENHLPEINDLLEVIIPDLVFSIIIKNENEKDSSKSFSSQITESLILPKFTFGQ